MMNENWKIQMLTTVQGRSRSRFSPRWYPMKSECEVKRTRKDLHFAFIYLISVPFKFSWLISKSMLRVCLPNRATLMPTMKEVTRVFLCSLLFLQLLWGGWQNWCRCERTRRKTWAWGEKKGGSTIPTFILRSPLVEIQPESSASLRSSRQSHSWWLHWCTVALRSELTFEAVPSQLVCKWNKIGPIILHWISVQG